MSYQLLHKPDGAAIRLLNCACKLAIILFQQDAPHLPRVLDALLQQRDSLCSLKNMCNRFGANRAQVLRVPEWQTLCDGARQRCGLRPVAVQRFALVVDRPARLVLRGPEAEVQGIEDKEPVYGPFRTIVKVIAIVP